LVAIAGGSGSGKTWLAEKLAAALTPNTERLSLDDFYLDRSHISPARRACINFDHPRAIDWATFERCLRRLAANGAARIPVYDFSTHCRLAQTSLAQPKPVILVEGLWLWRRPALRRLFSLRIFLECPSRTRLERRLARDLVSRQRTADSIQRQFKTMVEPMHKKYVRSQGQTADLWLRESCTEAKVSEIAKKIRSLLSATTTQ